MLTSFRLNAPKIRRVPLIPVAIPAAPKAPAPERTARHHNSMFQGVGALVVLLKAHRSLGITQIATALGVSKSTAHDLVAALCELGFVEQNLTTRRYAISPQIFQFLHLFSTEYGANPALKPLLRTEAAKLKASVVVTALRLRTTYALCASGPAADTFLLGDNGPAYTSACGKILVSQFDETVWCDYAPVPDDKPSSPYSNLDPQRFFCELRAARIHGVAWNIRERDAALCSVAAPICSGEMPWSRAVGIVLPYGEWVVRDCEELAAQVKALATRISESLPG